MLSEILVDRGTYTGSIIPKDSALGIEVSSFDQSVGSIALIVKDEATPYFEHTKLKGKCLVISNILDLRPAITCVISHLDGARIVGSDGRFTRDIDVAS